MEFLTDYLRLMVCGNLNAYEIENLMDGEIEPITEAYGPVNALGRLAGALPAFGIVAAVLGVVNTMGSVGQPPAILGGMIGSALVGTFLGMLLAYGVVGPLGELRRAEAQRRLERAPVHRRRCWRGCTATRREVAVEFGRKVLYSTERPSVCELESTSRARRHVAVRMADDSTMLKPISIVKRIHKGGHDTTAARGRSPTPTS